MTMSPGLALTLARPALAAALSTVLKAVERKNVIPVYGHLLLTATSDALVVAGTDGDMLSTVRVPAEVATPGAVTVPSGDFEAFVRRLPADAEISIAVDPARPATTVRSGRARCTLPGYGEAEFPRFGQSRQADGSTHDETADLPHRFALPGAVLADLLAKTQFAISTEETRYYLNGIYLHTVGERLRVVATDGHRLARVEAEVPDLDPTMPGVIVPRKTVGVLRGLVEGADVVQVGVSRAYVRFEAGTRVLASKLIDGTFPDYERVIPTGNERRLVAPSAELIQVVERVAHFVPSGKALRLALADGHLDLTARGADGADAADELEVDYDAAPLEIGFNPRYLAEVLAVMGGDTALFDLGDAGAPAVLRRRESDPALFVLMPMRV